MENIIEPKKTVKYLITESIIPLEVGEAVAFPRDSGAQVANFRSRACEIGKKLNRKYSVRLTDTYIIVERIN